MLNRHVALLASLAAILFVAAQARAIDYTWNATGGGAFNTNTNWTPASGPVVVPGVSDRAIFNLNNTYTVTFASNVTNTAFRQTQGSVTLDIGSGRAYAISGSDNFQLGNTAFQTANLTVSTGTLSLTSTNTNTGGIGTVANSTGILLVTGAGTLFTTNGTYCDIGVSGTGTVTVQNGASASIGAATFIGGNSGSNGTLKFYSSGTQTLGANCVVGQVGTGTLDVDFGATATIGSGLIVGNNSGAFGTFKIGTGGTSTNANTSGFTIGNASGSTGILNVVYGNNTLTNVGQVNIAALVGSIGTANVGQGGINAFWNQSGGSIYVGGTNSGSGGAGTLNANGGTINVTGAGNGIVIRGGSGANIGTVNLSAGAINTVNFTRDSNGVFNFTGGTLTINGVLSSNGPLSLGGAGNPQLVFNSGSTTSNLTNLSVANTGTANLIVNAGAAPSANLVYLGTASGTFGAASLNAGGTLTVAQEFGAGSGGTGVLNVNNGGSLIVNGASNFAFAGLGNNSLGGVNLAAGGTISSGRAFVGGNLGTGTANIFGTWTTVGTFEVGGYTTGGSPILGTSGVVNVFSGGQLNIGSSLIIYGPGTVNLSGGQINAPGFTILPSGGGDFNFNSGTYAFTNGWSATPTQVNALLGASATIGTGKTVQVTGTMDLFTGLTLNGGTLRVGTLNGAGSLALNSGTLELTNSSLAVSPTGLLGSLVTVESGMNIKVTNGSSNVSVASGSTLFISGGLVQAPAATINGLVQLSSPIAQLNSRVTVNSGGVLQGTGQVGDNLTVNAGGTVRVLGTDYGLYRGVSNTINGNVDLQGGSVEWRGPVTVGSTGFIGGRGSINAGSATPGGAGVTVNSGGLLSFSGGNTDIRGDVINNTGATITNSGGGVVTFYDDVLTNGDIRTFGGARTVFLGSQGGDGMFPGSGTVEYAGDLRPGNSPASTTYGGDVVLGSGAGLHIELGGTIAGSQYDQVNVLGTIFLDGMLDVTLDNGFQPNIGDRFDIATFGYRNGDFSSLWGLNLGNGLALVPVIDGHTYSLVVSQVPEPGTLALLGAATACGYVVRRRLRNRRERASGAA